MRDLGGAVTGFLVGMNVLRNFHHKVRFLCKNFLRHLMQLLYFKRWEGILRLICVLVWTALLIVAILINAVAGEAIFPDSDFSPLTDGHCTYLPGRC